MTKITIPPVSGGFDLKTTVDARLQQIEDELNTKVLYKTNPVGGDNSLDNDIDMDGYDLLNVGVVNATNIIVDGTEYLPVLEALTEEAQAAAISASESATAGGSTLLMFNYQSIRDYAGAEQTFYARGQVIAGDAGEAFFQKKTGAAPGFYVDDNESIIIPTGGDGSIGWIREIASLDVSTVAEALANINSPSVINVTSYDTNKVASSGSRWVTDGTTGTPSTTSFATGHIYNAAGDGYLFNGDALYCEQFGARAGASDNSSAIQSTMDYASLAYGGIALIGAGSFTYLTTLIMRFNSALQGTGYSTRLLPVSINAFSYEASGIPAGRAVTKGLWIQGNNTIGSIAFDATVADGGAGLAIKGISFENIFVQDFENAWEFTGVWNGILSNCHTSDVWKAINLVDRNVHIVLDSCSFIRGSTPVGFTGDCVGVFQKVGGFSFRTEDLQIKNTLVFGFDKGIELKNILYCDIEGSDIDFCVETGIQIVNAEGSCSVKSCWVFTLGDQGIIVSSIGTAHNDQLTLANNNRERATQGTLAAVTGIEIGTGQANTSVVDNHIRNFHIATKLGSPGTRYIGNWDSNTNSHSLQIFDTAPGCYVRDNNFEQTVDRTSAKPHIYFGANEGVLTEHVLQVVMTGGVLSQVFTWASLGLPDGINNSRILTFVNNPNAGSMGNVRAVSTGTQVTVYRDTALGGLAALDLHITSN